MRDVTVSFQLECDCRTPIAATHAVTHVIGGTAQTDSYECRKCGNKYFLHIQQVKVR